MLSRLNAGVEFHVSKPANPLQESPLSTPKIMSSYHLKPMCMSFQMNIASILQRDDSLVWTAAIENRVRTGKMFSKHRLKSEPQCHPTRPCTHGNLAVKQNQSIDTIPRIPLTRLPIPGSSIHNMNVGILVIVRVCIRHVRELRIHRELAITGVPSVEVDILSQADPVAVVVPNGDLTAGLARRGARGGPTLDEKLAFGEGGAVGWEEGTLLETLTVVEGGQVEGGVVCVSKCGIFGRRRVSDDVTELGIVGGGRWKCRCE
jgi:hypothetical protein